MPSSQSTYGNRNSKERQALPEARARHVRFQSHPLGVVNLAGNSRQKAGRLVSHPQTLRVIGSCCAVDTESTLVGSGPTGDEIAAARQNFTRE
jgi:hypothetical protein